MKDREYQYVELNKGKTCFEKVGDSSKPIVVFVHGLSSPMCIWNKNIYELSNDCCAIRYDLYGRGNSARPIVSYDADLFVNQLYELIQTLALSLPVSLVGLSMGGAIVSDFAVRYPEMVDKMVLIAPAGLLKRTWGMKLMGMPFVGTILYEVFGKKALIKGVLETIGDSMEDKIYMQKVYEEQMRIPGYREAILSTLKQGPICDMEDVYIQLGKQKREGCLIWGEKDNVVPFCLSKQIIEWVPWLTLHAVKDGTHAVNYQKANIVNAILCSFFNR
ncbi:MAG TPA: alpha/beta hydrolase [Candidatus Hydrogenedens sp.]|nr:alpha/beta hydrolase [Candidatus Hydrogenedens sp.]